MSNYSIKDSDDQNFELISPVSFSYAHTNENDRNGDASDTSLQTYVNNGYLDMRVDVKDGVLVGDSDQYVLKAKSVYYEFDLGSEGFCSDLNIVSPTIDKPSGFLYQDDIVDALPILPNTISVINGVNQI